MESKYSQETLKMLIKFYNMIAGSSFRAGNEYNQRFVSNALDAVDGSIATLKLYIKKWVNENQNLKNSANALHNCFSSIKPNSLESTTTQSQPTEQAVANSLGILEQAVAHIIAQTQAENIKSEIMGNVQQSVRDFIKSEYGSIERKITTVIDGERKELTGLIHEKFDTVLKFVANNEPVFLTGPAGSGKNHICKQVADALGLRFYFTNAVTQEYKLTGFTDAMGNYQPTQFYKAFTEGGVFMLDEMDASIPEVLVILNAAIANRYFDFPAPIGYREAHPDFRVIAAGNTTGHGASYEYVGRNQLDAASLDRFAIVPIDYSMNIENGMAADIELADFCREFRKASEKVGLQIIVSYRAIGRLAKMTKLLDLTEALSTCLTKGMEKDDINIICNELHESKYKSALKKLAA